MVLLQIHLELELRCPGRWVKREGEIEVLISFAITSLHPGYQISFASYVQITKTVIHVHLCLH